MPWAASECRARWICAASVVGLPDRRCCSCQYCITIAMLAAPQPSFSCFTKGISSQMPEGSAAQSTPPTHSTRTMTRMTRGMGFLLAYRDNNQNQSRDEDQNNDQVPVAEVAGGEIGLRPLSLRRQLCQFSIAKTGHRLLHLLRVRMSSLQCALRPFRGEKFLQGIQILLPYSGGIHGCFLQLNGTHYVFGSLGEEILWNGKDRNQKACRQNSNALLGIKVHLSHPPHRCMARFKNSTRCRICRAVYTSLYRVALRLFLGWSNLPEIPGGFLCIHRRNKSNVACPTP